MSLPSNASGIALTWIGVGLEYFSPTAAWSSRASSPKSLNWALWAVSFGFESVFSGMSCLLSFRFIVVTAEVLAAVRDEGLEAENVITT